MIADSDTSVSSRRLLAIMPSRTSNGPAYTSRFTRNPEPASDSASASDSYGAGAAVRAAASKPLTVRR